MILCSNPLSETRHTLKCPRQNKLFSYPCSWKDLVCVPHYRTWRTLGCQKIKRLTESLHSLEVNGEVVLSPLLQQFLQQVVEPFRVVEAGVLGELLTVLIWHLEKKRIILKPRHSHPEHWMELYSPHTTNTCPESHTISLLPDRGKPGQCWAHWRAENPTWYGNLELSCNVWYSDSLSNLQLPGESSSILVLDTKCIGVLTHI